MGLIRRYVSFRAEGTGEGLGRVLVEGVCDARCDPMQVAMARSQQLTKCSRVRLAVEPAFAIACSGARQKTRRTIRELALMQGNR